MRSRPLAHDLVADKAQEVGVMNDLVFESKETAIFSRLADCRLDELAPGVTPRRQEHLQAAQESLPDARGPKDNAVCRARQNDGPRQDCAVRDRQRAFAIAKPPATVALRELRRRISSMSQTILAGAATWRSSSPTYRRKVRVR